MHWPTNQTASTPTSSPRAHVDELAAPPPVGPQGGGGHEKAPGAAGGSLLGWKRRKRGLFFLHGCFYNFNVNVPIHHAKLGHAGAKLDESPQARVGNSI